ncbi:FtsX-like permease family protein [Undibacterium sp. LX40W]|uniref:FtsX-like permease family protein n=1 Tax=Undibacterium nitidum TaxID=2762298 RepID=A0A923HIS8_9BURK|nr:MULTISPECIES: FtsX-like permease family protein [Undibacterium]MBC3880510.1 FtsX-like permease family protein [Undibacterium nitidum]MBC3890754.1 FtsX-like permease family protein [Undibacterium sp. LX40W]
MFSLALKMTQRDWRSGELRFLLIALMVAVASLSSVGFFVDRMRAGLTRDASQVLASDLLVSSTKEISVDWKNEAHQRGLQVAETVVFPSMAIAGEGDNTTAKLVTIKAVSAAYPLRGVLKLESDAPDPKGKKELAAHGVPKTATAWVDPALLPSLNAKLGDTVTLGDQKFELAASIASEPDRGSGFLGFAPRVMIALDDLPATKLIQDGSRATYRFLLAGDKRAIAAFQEFLEKDIADKKLKGTRIETIENGNEQLKTTLERAEQFLSMVSILSAMLSAVAIAMAARRFMLRHIDACAMLRCLGLTQNQVTAMYLWEFVLLGVLGSLAGVALGFAGHYVLLEWLGKLVANDLPSATLLPALQGLAIGMLLLLGFAMPPILQLRNVPHNRVIRREQDAPQVSVLLSYGSGLAMFIGLLLWQTGDVKVGLMVAAGFLVGMGLFALIAWSAISLLKRFRTLFSGAAWRFAITALQRRPGATVTQVVALALGLMALLLLTVVRGDLISAWKKSTPADAPNHFIINIQPDQKASIENRLKNFASPEVYPMIRGRLIQVNDQVLTPKSYQDERANSLVEREFNLSTMKALPDLNKVVAGEWYDDDKATEPEASVEEGLAKNLKLKLGDRMTFDIAGQKVTARITSLRKLDWGSMRVNFFVVINPKAMRDMPQTFITAFRVPEDQKQFPSQLTRDFPNLTVMDVGAIVKQLQDVLDQVITAVEFLFLFTLTSGVLVLYAALAGSQDLRMREAALLRALGATRSQLSHAQWVEFILVGSLAGLFAAAGASAIGWVLATFAFKFAWTFSPMVWLAGIVVGALCAMIGGWLGLRNVLNQPPLLSLRNA